MADESKATTAKGRQAGGYEPPILVEPRGGPVPGGGTPAADTTSRDDSRRDAEALQKRWPTLAEPLVSALVAAIGSGGVADLATVSTPPAILADLAAAVGDAMTQAATATITATVAVARASGIEIDPPEPDRRRIDDLAAVAVGLIAAAYTTAAVRRALQVGPTTAATAVAETLTAMGTAKTGVVAEQFGAATHAARNLGRQAVYSTHQPAGFVADEADDHSACKPCRDIAGHTYQTLDEALADYPGTAGYRACLGGIRCRGYVRARWK